MQTQKPDSNFNTKFKGQIIEKEISTAQQVLNGFLIFCEFLLLNIRIWIEVIKAVYRKIAPSEKSVKGEIVLVTGCGHGIGKELSLQYAALGATVVGWDLNLETCQQTVKEILAMGGTKAHAYQCDVTDKTQILELAKKVQREVGDVSIVVNNAGIMPCHPFLEHTEQEIKKIFEINVFAHFWMLEAFLPGMLERNHGHIVALSSMAGVLGLKNLVPYCASKFAVRGLMEALSEELRQIKPEHQIKFTTICPYMVDTGLCKNPKIRFQGLLNLLPPKAVAEFIIQCQRRDVIETSVPSYMLYMNYFLRMYPENCGRMLRDFLDTGTETDKM